MPISVLRRNNALRRAPSGGIQHQAAQKQYRGGQFIPDDLWQAERRKAESELPGLVASFTDDLQYHRRVFETAAALRRAPTEYHVEGMLSADQIERQIKKCIRENYQRAFLLGKRTAGNLTSANVKDSEAVKASRLDEYQYLRRFLRDMDTRGGRMPYAKRMDYYGKALRELFWLGWLLADTSPERMVRWVLGKTEHCSTCLKMAEHGSWKASELAEQAKKGILPQSGALECLGYGCGCGLEDVKE